jgi:hypothetical protein
MMEQISTNENRHSSELYDITNVVQAKVKGAQLNGFNIEELRVNPCMNEKEPYFWLVCCQLRRKLIIKTNRSSVTINIGSFE